jgi:RNase P/RNase MRP subunit p30
MLDDVRRDYDIEGLAEVHGLNVREADVVSGRLPLCDFFRNNIHADTVACDSSEMVMARS